MTSPSTTFNPGPFARSSNTFGLDLWRHVPAGNQVFSPASLALALGMTLGGARGATADQMARVLHVEGDPAAFHRAASSVLAGWQARPSRRASTSTPGWPSARLIASAI